MSDASFGGDALGAGDAASVVLDKLRRLILMGGLAPGSPLNQEALADDFGVSRMPIRQALKRLQTEGLVERQPNRRVRVSLLQRNEIEDIFDMRIVLEPLAFRLAVPRADKVDIRAMARAFEDTTDDDDPATFGMRNTAYHMSLVLPCRRPRLLGEIRSLLDLSDRYQRAAYDDPTFMQPLQDDHETMLAFVREGRSDDAAAVLEKHIRHGRDRLVQLFT